MKNNITKSRTITIKDPISALTHFIGALISLESVTPLIIKSHTIPSFTKTLSLSIFITSMIILYMASAIYHTFDINPRINQYLRKIDHMSIYLLIAGTYTPICLIILHNRMGNILLTLIWILAILGMIFNAFWITCPKWLSSTIYVVMGWLSMFAASKIISCNTHAFYWLLAGGIVYTIGGIIYALKLPIFNKKHASFGSHEIFHIFVMVGSACHFILMYNYVATLPIN